MINLSGFSVKDKQNPEGDIEIKIIGLRPGEKLYEELLIGDDPQSTDHKKIKKINDPFVASIELEKSLNELEILLNENKINEVKKLLERLVKLYKSNSKIVDHLYLEGLITNKYEKKLSFDMSQDNIKINNKDNKVIKFNK